MLRQDRRDALRRREHLDVGVEPWRPMVPVVCGNDRCTNHPAAAVAAITLMARTLQPRPEPMGHRRPRTSLGPGSTSTPGRRPGRRGSPALTRGRRYSTALRTACRRRSAQLPSHQPMAAAARHTSEVATTLVSASWRCTVLGEPVRLPCERAERGECAAEADADQGHRCAVVAPPTDEQAEEQRPDDIHGERPPREDREPSALHVDIDPPPRRGSEGRTECDQDDASDGHGAVSGPSSARCRTAPGPCAQSRQRSGGRRASPRTGAPRRPRP